MLLCCIIWHYGTYHKLHKHHQGNKSPALPEESTVPLYVLIGSGFADLLPVLADNPWNLQVFVAVTYHAFGYRKFSTINTYKIICHAGKACRNKCTVSGYFAPSQKQIKCEDHLVLQILKGLNMYHHVKYETDLIKCLLQENNTCFQESTLTNNFGSISPVSGTPPTYIVLPMFSFLGYPLRCLRLFESTIIMILFPSRLNTMRCHKPSFKSWVSSISSFGCPLNTSRWSRLSRSCNNM